MSAPVAPFPQVDHQRAVFADGLALDCGMTIAPLAVAYRTYGTLNAARSNAILVCHALTGDQYVAETQPLTGKPGWWETHHRPRQAARHRPLLPDLRQRAGRLHGQHRPARGDRSGAAGRPWGTDFPNITIRDMVRAQSG